jgi:hypothetical protein
MVAHPELLIVGPSPYDLKPSEVMHAVETSSPDDWIYTEEDDCYSYRSNLLINIAREGDALVLNYGSDRLGPVPDRVVSRS